MAVFLGGLLARVGLGAVTRATGATAARAGATATARAGAATTARVGAGTAGRAATTASSFATRAGNAANLAWAGSQILGGMQSVIAGVMNDFTHVITVEVHGGPKADIKRIWQLAVSAAFGKYRQGVNGGGNLTIAANWDITGKAVSVQLHYDNQGLRGNLINSGPQRFGGSGATEAFLRVGPSQELVGADWTSIKALFSGIAGVDGLPGNNTLAQVLSDISRQVNDEAVARAGQAVANALQALGPIPVRGGGGLEATFIPAPGITSTRGDPLGPLPDDGRLILTANKLNPDVQPYKPNTDYLIALVSAALVDPCVMPVSPPTDAEAGQKAVRRIARLYDPGAGDTSRDRVNNATDRETILPIDIPTNGFISILGGPAAVFLNQGQSRDGYKKPTLAETPNVRGATNAPR